MKFRVSVIAILASLAVFVSASRTGMPSPSSSAFWHGIMPTFAMSHSSLSSDHAHTFYTGSISLGLFSGHAVHVRAPYFSQVGNIRQDAVQTYANIWATLESLVNNQPRSYRLTCTRSGSTQWSCAMPNDMVIHEKEAQAMLDAMNQWGNHFGIDVLSVKKTVEEYQDLDSKDSKSKYIFTIQAAKRDHARMPSGNLRGRSIVLNVAVHASGQ